MIELAITAVVAGDAVTAARYNELTSMQPSTLVYEGIQVDAKDAAGTTEYSMATYDIAMRIQPVGVTSVERIILKLKKNAGGNGQDIVVELRDNTFNPTGVSDGTLLKTIYVPKEFISYTAGWASIPLAIEGLTASNYYWIIMRKVGDTTHHNKIIGEASQDASHPVYTRTTSSGAWTANNALHFKLMADASGIPVHEMISTTAWTTIVLSGNNISKIGLYLAPSGTAAGGIRQVYNAVWWGTRFKGFVAGSM